MKRLLVSLVLLIPPLLLLRKLWRTPVDPIPITTSAEEAEVRGAEAAAAEHSRVVD